VVRRLGNSTIQTLFFRLLKGSFLKSCITDLDSSLIDPILPFLTLE
jgi:hypothetical protein